PPLWPTPPAYRFWNTHIKGAHHDRLRPRTPLGGAATRAQPWCCGAEREPTVAAGDRARQGADRSQGRPPDVRRGRAGRDRPSQGCVSADQPEPQQGAGRGHRQAEAGIRQQAGRALQRGRQGLRDALHRTGAQGDRRLLQDAARQEDAGRGSGRDPGGPGAGEGLGERLFQSGARQDAGRNEEERPRSVSQSAGEVDLFVIGAGSGGVRAARIAAGHGARVMIAEEYRVGGTCVIRGCVPKKLLVYASRFAREFEDAAGFGWTVPPPVFDWPTLIANKDQEIARLEAAYTATLDKAGVKIVKSRAVLDDSHTVHLATGERVKAGHILVATGAAPQRPAIPGIEHVITSNEAFHLPLLPRRILVQGGGYIAIEFACIFAGLGAEVVLVYRGDNILRGFDNDVRTHLRGELEKSGITVITGRTVTAVEHSGHAYPVRLSDGRWIDVDKVMFALGRAPNVAGLGLEAA